MEQLAGDKRSGLFSLVVMNRRKLYKIETRRSVGGHAGGRRGCATAVGRTSAGPANATAAVGLV